MSKSCYLAVKACFVVFPSMLTPSILIVSYNTLLQNFDPFFDQNLTSIWLPMDKVYLITVF